MIISSCPLRVSFAGGSTDLQSFIDKNGHGSVINCAINLRTYITLHQDVLGFSSRLHKYIVNYTTREEEKNICDIKNNLVRECFRHFKTSPCTSSLTSDVFSSGSGLASSSSYLVGLIKAVCKHQKIKKTNFDICSESILIERKFNPLVGYQDPFGCGIGGLNRIDIEKPNVVKIEPLNSNIFHNLDMHLIHTKVSRKSTRLLGKINERKSKKLLSLVDEIEKAIEQSDIKSFVDIVNEGLKKKKESNPLTINNTAVSGIDKVLSEEKDVLCHKLCGAGNGGFFLLFTKTGYDTSKIRLNRMVIPISISKKGVGCYEV